MVFDGHCRFGENNLAAIDTWFVVGNFSTITQRKQTIILQCKDNCNIFMQITVKIYVPKHHTWLDVHNVYLRATQSCTNCLTLNNLTCQKLSSYLQYSLFSCSSSKLENVQWLQMRDTAWWYKRWQCSLWQLGLERQWSRGISAGQLH